MAKKRLIARAGRGLLNVLALLFRSLGALCAAMGSFVLFAWKHSNGGAQSEEFGAEYDRVVKRELREGRY